MFRPMRAQDRVMAVLATCAYALQSCISILDGSGLILTDEQSAESSQMLIQHCKAYSWLSTYFFNKRAMLFKLRPKFHFLYHQALQLQETKVNVNAFATWSEEPFLGKCKAIYCACHGGTVNQRFFERYLLCLALMLKRHSMLESYYGGVSSGVAP